MQDFLFVLHHIYLRLSSYQQFEVAAVESGLVNRRGVQAVERKRRKSLAQIQFFGERWESVICSQYGLGGVPPVQGGAVEAGGGGGGLED